MGTHGDDDGTDVLLLLSLSLVLSSCLRPPRHRALGCGARQLTNRQPTDQKTREATNQQSNKPTKQQSNKRPTHQTTRAEIHSKSTNKISKKSRKKQPTWLFCPCPKCSMSQIHQVGIQNPFKINPKKIKNPLKIHSKKLQNLLKRCLGTVLGKSWRGLGVV